MDFRNEARHLLVDFQPGRVMKTAYDTAWVARLGEIDSNMSNAALRWISENQLPDGSWGAPAPLYYHDRVISTLAAMIALTWRGRRYHDRQQIELGLAALDRITGGATQGLMGDPNGATVGFEMIVPTLIAEAEKLKIIQNQGERILGRLKRLREAKMARLNGLRINRNLTIAYSSEMAGSDCQHLLDLDNLQETNGSIACSPSTTAYYASQVCPGDPDAIKYLRGVVAEDGGAPLASPLDIYERAWVLWNLALTGDLDDELRALCEPHLKAIEPLWKPGRGVPFATGYSVRGGDETSLVYAVLTQFGRAIDLDALYHYEEPGYFRCYDIETNPSISANAHFLEAFRQTGLERDHPAVQKILRFLYANREANGYWLDKWHISPYYTTAHIIIAAMDYDRELAASAVDWILKTRSPKGSWGFFMPTAEETAYALQALCYWRRKGGQLPRQIIQESSAWLADHTEPPYPPFWISKTLYYSEWVVRAEILSALMMAAQSE